MMHCSVQPGDRIFVNSHGFLSFAKTMGRNIGKNISKNVSGKYSNTAKKPLDHSKKSTIDALKITSRRVIQKTAAGDLINNKV